METQKAKPRSERLGKARVRIEQLHEEMEAETDNLSEELGNGNRTHTQRDVEYASADS